MTTKRKMAEERAEKMEERAEKMEERAKKMEERAETPETQPEPEPEPEVKAEVVSGESDDGKTVIRPNTDDYQSVRSASGSKSQICGDEVSVCLAGMDVEQVKKVAVGMDMATADVNKYDHLNPGQIRMNLGNRIRGIVARLDRDKDTPENAGIDKLKTIAVPIQELVRAAAEKAEAAKKELAEKRAKEKAEREAKKKAKAEEAKKAAEEAKKAKAEEATNAEGPEPEEKAA